MVLSTSHQHHQPLSILNDSPTRTTNSARPIQSTSQPRKPTKLPTSASESALASTSRNKNKVDLLDEDDDEGREGVFKSQPKNMKPFILRSTTTTTSPPSASGVAQSNTRTKKKKENRFVSFDVITSSHRINAAVTSDVHSSVEAEDGIRRPTTKRKEGRIYFVPDENTDDSPRSETRRRRRSPSKRKLEAEPKQDDRSTMIRTRSSMQGLDLDAQSTENELFGGDLSTELSHKHDQTELGSSPIATISSPIVKVIPSPNRKSRTNQRRSIQVLPDSPPRPRSPIASTSGSAAKNLISTSASSTSALKTPISARSLSKKKSRYENVSRSLSRDRRPVSRSRKDGSGAEEEESPAEYRSMQEMLEASGFKDTRVVTPISAPHKIVDLPPSSLGIPIPGPFPTSKSNDARSPTLVDDPGFSSYYGSPSSLHPPLSKNHRASMLSLRGLFSLWKAEEEHNTAAPLVQDITSSHEEADAISDEANSEDTITLRTRKDQFLLKTQAWVDEVAREAATLSISPAMLRASLEPKSFAAMVKHETSPPVETPRKVSAPRPSKAIVEINRGTLRHVVSDPQFASHRLPSPGHYQSFSIANMGIEFGNLSPTTTRLLKTTQSVTQHQENTEEEEQGFLNGPVPVLQYDDIVSETGSGRRSRRTRRQRAQTPAPISDSPATYWTSLTTLKTKASTTLLSFFAPLPPPTKGGPAVEQAKKIGAPKIVRKAVSSTALKPVLSKAMDQDFDWEMARRRIKNVEREGRGGLRT